MKYDLFLFNMKINNDENRKCKKHIIYDEERQQNKTENIISGV